VCADEDEGCEWSVDVAQAPERAVAVATLRMSDENSFHQRRTEEMQGTHEMHVPFKIALLPFSLEPLSVGFITPFAITLLRSLNYSPD